MDIKSFFEQYKLYVFGGIAGVVIVVYFFMSSNTEQANDLSFDFNTVEESQVEEELPAVTEQPTTVFVEVKGAVLEPGVYELPMDARVKNVLDIAVLVDQADLMTVNQSMKLTDEMVIYIPYEGEIESTAAALSQTGTETSSAEGLVNINTAEIQELTTLNGIGEKKAQAILTYRDEQGLFSTLEELKNIPGIGDKTFENLEPYITIN